MRFWASLVMVVCAGAALQGDNFGDLRNIADLHTNTHFTPALYHSAPEWNARKLQLRKHILAAAGLYPQPARTPLQVQREPAARFPDFTVEKLSFEPLPNLRIAANLYLPVAPRRRAPAILVPHGHWKKGRLHDDEEYSVPKLCANLARQGYVALAWDMLGYNETRQLPHEFGGSPEEQLWAFHPLGLQLWTAIRAIDLLEALPEVDAQRIGVTGASGGGTQTMLLAAVDDRIRASAPVVMVSAIFQGDDACEMAPSLRIGTYNVEIAAMAAPRPTLLISSAKDWTRNTRTEEFPALLSIYRLFQVPGRATFHHSEDKHNYNKDSREAAYVFFNQHLRRTRLPGQALKERETPAFDDDTLRFAKPFTSDDRPGYDQLLSAWRERAMKQSTAQDPAALRDTLRVLTGVDAPARVTATFVPNRLLLSRDGYGERIPARWYPAESSAAAILAGAGDSVTAYRNAGWNVLTVDPYQTGDAVAERPSPRKDHLVFHHSDDARRVQDIVTAIAYLAPAPFSKLHLVCGKDAALWCLAAAAISPRPLTLVAPTAGRTGTDSDLKSHLFLPGLQRVGGLVTLRRLAADRLETANPGYSTFSQMGVKK